MDLRVLGAQIYSFCRRETPFQSNVTGSWISCIPTPYFRSLKQSKTGAPLLFGFLFFHSFRST